MTDRELLELSAKAAGVKVFSYIDNPMFGTGINSGDIDVPLWNPLNDDGDALRLATSLCMSVRTGPCAASATTISGALRGTFFTEETIHQAQDVAVRRVIVRAAAEIGKAMP